VKRRKPGHRHDVGRPMTDLLADAQDPLRGRVYSSESGWK
jgi:hypothetical protein